MRRLTVRLVRFVCRVACVLSCPALLAAGPEPPREPPAGRGDPSIRASLTDAAEKVVLPGRCRECHAAEFDAWEATEHATAFESLHRSRRAKEIAGRLDLRLIRRGHGDGAPACLSCHYTPVVRRGRLRAGAGVSCESCHGPARDWVSLHGGYGVPEADFQKAARLETATHRAQRIADSTAAGMRRSSHLVELAATCFGCHTVANEEIVNRGGHSTGGDFELVEWSGRVRHNFLESYRTGDGRTNAERPRAWKRVLYVVGRALAVEHALRGVAAATEDDLYFAAMRDRARAAVDELLAVDERVGIPEVRAAIAMVESAELALDNPGLLAAADAVRTATKAFAAGADGDTLAPLDPLWDPDLEEAAPPARRLTGAAPEVGPIVVGDASPTGGALPEDVPERESPGSPAPAEGGPGAAADAGTGTTGPPAPERAHPPAVAPPRVPAATLARPPWREPPAHDFVGVPCGGCHNAQQKWWLDNPHSRTAARLGNGDRRAVDIARAYGLSANDMARGTQTCMWCHGTLTSRPSRRVRAGVGCQRCHGAGADYRDSHQTASYAESVALGLTDLRDPAVQAATCAGCHYITDPGLIDAGHPTGGDFDILSRRGGIVHWDEAFGRGPDSVEPAALTVAHARVVAARGPVPARTRAASRPRRNADGSGRVAGLGEVGAGNAAAGSPAPPSDPRRQEASSPRERTPAASPRATGGAELANTLDTLRRHLDALYRALGLPREARESAP